MDESLADAFLILIVVLFCGLVLGSIATAIGVTLGWIQ